MARTLYFRLMSGFVFAGLVYVGGWNSSLADTGVNEKGAGDSTASDSASNLFDAMGSGELGVQFIPRDSREATLILTNNRDEPLSVRLPDAFAAVPVLAQQNLFGAGAPLNQPGNGTTGKSNQPQPLSTAGPPRTAQGQQQPRGGLMSIPPERAVKLKFAVVCLAYGKPEPTAHVPYDIMPLDGFTKSAELQELCRLLGTRKVEQPVAQAAAWHLANQMSWDKLAALKHWPHNHGFSHPVFTSEQISAAMKLADKAIKAAESHAVSVATSRD